MALSLGSGIEISNNAVLDGQPAVGCKREQGLGRMFDARVGGCRRTGPRMVTVSLKEAHGDRRRAESATLGGKQTRSSEGVPLLFKHASQNSSSTRWWEQLFQFSSDPWADMLPAQSEPVASPTLVPDCLGTLPGRDELLVPYDSIPVHMMKKVEVEAVEADAKRIRNLDWRGVGFTAQKARTLRRKLRGSETWHDTMYHSGIASRLAEAETDF